MPFSPPPLKDLKFFKTPADLRRWLERNHASRAVLWVGFHKRAAGKPSITWPEAVDQLLCYGWIDGVRVSVDQNSYAIRTTPRKPRSIWSAVNVRRARDLIRTGLMQEAGLAVFSRRDAARTNRYSFEREQAHLGSPRLKAFKANARAWRWFESQAPWYRKTAIWWVESAKQEKTREKRFAALLADSAAGLPVAPLRRPARTAPAGPSGKKVAE